MSPTGIISRSIEIGLYYIGAWPETAYSVLFRLFWIISMVIVLTSQYRYILLCFTSNDLPTVVDCLSIALPFNLTFLKLIFLWINRRRVRDIVLALTKDWRNYAVIDMKIMERTLHLSHRVSNAIIGLTAMSAVFYAAGVFVPLIKSKEGDVPWRVLLIKMALPFEIDKLHIYLLVTLSQFFHQVASAAVAGLSSSLLVTLVLHIGAQIDVVCQKLMEMSSQNEKQLKFVICEHQRIIAFTDNIEKLYVYMALMQILINTAIICCLGFLIVISMGTEDLSAVLTKCLLFYGVIAMEAFTFCFAGEYLSSKSRMIGKAAYQSLWYDLRPNTSRILVIVILRSQKELTISAGKFMNLSLQGFTNIMKASASYVSVLLAMY